MSEGLNGLEEKNVIWLKGECIEQWTEIERTTIVLKELMKPIWNINKTRCVYLSRHIEFNK